MRKITVLFLVASFLCMGLNGCGNSAAQTFSQSSTDNASNNQSSDSSSESDNNSDEEPYEVHFMYWAAKEGTNQDKVNQVMNGLTLEELNMTVDLMPTTIGTYNSTISVTLAADEELDVMPISSTAFATYIQSGYLVNLYDYVEYLDGAIEQLGDAAYVADVGGFLCGFTEMKERGFPLGLICRSDILTELGYTADSFSIDYRDYSTFEQIDELFAAVKEKYPDMVPFNGTTTIGTSPYSWFDGLGDNYGVLEDAGQATTVTNWYESEQFAQFAEINKRWFEAGYSSADIATNQDSGETLMKAGNTFSFIAYYKPNTTVEKKSQTGYDVTVIPLCDEGIKTTSGANSLVYSISNAAEDKEKAAIFLNFAYTNGDFMDIINWGVEGEDWVEDENGQATYPEGIDASNVATHNDYGWALPNQFIGHAWAGNPIDIWDQYKEYNDAMTPSVAYGFVFDSTVVSDQQAACKAVEDQYLKPISFGSVDDLDASIAEFNEKLYAAGLEDIIAAKQEQLDAWFAENK